MTTPVPVSQSQEIERALAAYEPKVRAAARRYGVDAGDIDLVLQETRLRLWRLAERGNVLAEVGPALMYRMAAGAAIDLRRRRDARREDREAAAIATASHDTSALDRLALRDALQRCIGALLTARRAVVGLHLHGAPREEIAMLLKWSDAKTRNLLYRGLDDLRQCLRASGFAEGR
jgi:RNA polymerase sigma factor (sigma-70 family)